MGKSSNGILGIGKSLNAFDALKAEVKESLQEARADALAMGFANPAARIDAAL